MCNTFGGKEHSIYNSKPVIQIILYCYLILQGSAVKITEAYEMVSVVAAQLNYIRDNVASEFQNIFTKYQAMAVSADTTITVPRAASRQTLRDNAEHENAEQYYHRTAFIPVLDHLVQQLNDRF